MIRILNIFKVKEVRNKVFIVAFILLCSRVLAAIPIPGIDAAALGRFLSGNQFFGFLNILSGSGLSQLSIAMLGLGPYITATIIMQLLTMIFPALKAMYYEEGSAGRARFNRYSRYLTVPLAVLQAYSFMKLLISRGVLVHFTWQQLLLNVIVVTAGSMIMVWLGEIITEQKIGNGISLLIFAGIVSRLPTDLGRILIIYNPGLLLNYIVFVILALIVIAGVVMMNEGTRKIPVSYAKRIRGSRVYGGVSTYLPLKVNQAGMIPIIFAISVLLLPQFASTVVMAFSANVGKTINEVVTKFMNNTLFYGIIYFVLVFVFTYFYTAVTFDPKEVSKNLQRSGGFIPGLRPGEQTSIYLRKVTSRITLFGALFLGIVAILPLATQAFITNSPAMTVGGAALLIVVAVALETAQQIDSQLTIREYEGIK
jgi:preprotein translocase subunit SecY